MSGKEIVTLQIGKFANFLGSHWWNLQGSCFSYDSKQPSEVNHDILFREGCTSQGLPTYVPRLVSIDLKGSLGSLKQDGLLYYPNPKHEPSLWRESIEVHKMESLPRNNFIAELDKNQEPSNIGHVDDDKDICQASESTTESPKFMLDEKVSFWSDYLSMHLHPRSVHLIQDYTNNNEVEPFDVYYYGECVMSSEDQMDEVEGRLRYFVEECDHLQGFQLLLDANSGFGGVASTIACYLRDEYSKKGIMTLPLFDVSPATEILKGRWRDVMNWFLVLERLATLSDLTVPLSCFESVWKHPRRSVSLPRVNYKADLLYHTSAILASAVDTASMTYRVKENSADFTDFLAGLNMYGRKFSAMSTTFPLPVYENISMIDTILSFGSNVVPKSLTPSCKVTGNNSLAQSFVLRGGLPLNFKLKGVPIRATPRSSSAIERMETFHDVMRWFLSEACPSRFGSLMQVKTAVSVDDPFPHIFDSHLSAEGMMRAQERPSNTGVKSVLALCGIHSSDHLSVMLEELLQQVSACDVKRLHQFTTAGLEPEEMIQSMENLRGMCACYTQYGIYA